MAVIGGGMTGIAAALELAKSGRFEVTLFEKADHIGGLSDHYTWSGLTWDRFYHVILSTDTVMLDFIREIGLENQLFWQDTKSGFYGDGKLVSMSTPMDFLRFPFLSLWQKFRLGLGILYSCRIKDPTKLDRIYVREWLTRVFGRRVYESIWDPLLRSKLGNAREKTSAAFIWATITRLYGARTAENKQEKMGHVHGGYKTILDAAEKKLQELGVKIILNAPVTKIEPVSAFDLQPQTSNEAKPLASNLNPQSKAPPLHPAP
ncbi:Phytoene desaturase (EC [Olavius algarvensis associated proteobacterium Delta 3]|nr:Phytoene desaturase (EC [Olavius algarvensis associated proteobacterium Delta 3]